MNIPEKLDSLLEFNKAPREYLGGTIRYEVEYIAAHEWDGLDIPEGWQLAVTWYAPTYAERGLMMMMGGGPDEFPFDGWGLLQAVEAVREGAEKAMFGVSARGLIRGRLGAGMEEER